MVIMIGIGHYDENPISADIRGYLSDLDGIDIDIKNVVKLFTRNLP